MRKIAIAMSVALAGTALAGCGAGESEGEAPKVAEARAAKADVDPCSFISAEEMTAITTDRVIRTQRSGDTCKYHAAPDDGPEVVVSIGDAEKRMEVVRRSLGLLKGIGKEVSGQGAVGGDVGGMLQGAPADKPEVGDDAVWGLNGTLSARKGAVFAEVTPPIMHDPADHPGYPLVSREEKRAISLKVIETILARAGS
jgi:hypothetical protein